MYTYDTNYTHRILIGVNAVLPEGPVSIISPAIARYLFTPGWRVKNVDEYLG